MSERHKKASRAYWDSPAGDARREALRAQFKAQSAKERSQNGVKWWRSLTEEAKRARLEKMHAAATLAGAQRKGALARWAKTTPEERKAHAAKMRAGYEGKPPSEARLRAIAQARARLTPEKLSEMGKKGAASLNAKTTKAQKRTNARLGAAMRYFKKRGYIVEAE